MRQAQSASVSARLSAVNRGLRCASHPHGQLTSGVNRVDLPLELPGCFEIEGADRLSDSEQVMFQSRVSRTRRPACQASAGCTLGTMKHNGQREAGRKVLMRGVQRLLHYGPTRIAGAQGVLLERRSCGTWCSHRIATARFSRSAAEPNGASRLGSAISPGGPRGRTHSARRRQG